MELILSKRILKFGLHTFSPIAVRTRVFCEIRGVAFNLSRQHGSYCDNFIVYKACFHLECIVGLFPQQFNFISYKIIAMPTSSICALTSRRYFTTLDGAGLVVYQFLFDYIVSIHAKNTLHLPVSPKVYITLTQIWKCMREWFVSYSVGRVILHAINSL